MPKLLNLQPGYIRFVYRGPQAQFQVNDVTIMADGHYDTDIESEIAALRARYPDGVRELDKDGRAVPESK